MRLLSPRDTQILPNSCRCRRYQCRRCNPAQVRARWRTWSLLCFIFWWSVVEPSWDDRGYSIWGCLPLFWFHSRTFDCIFDDVWTIYVLCEVATVSQLFIPFYSVHGTVWRLPLLRQTYHASMPLSRALTRGKYSCIVGVTSWYQSHPRLRSPLVDRIADVVESTTKCFESYRIIYVLCEVAIVSQLFIPFLFSTWDVWRLPLLWHAYYAVMPLSRAPTRGRYSRIVGVTSW